MGRRVVTAGGKRWKAVAAQATGARGRRISCSNWLSQPTVRDRSAAARATPESDGTRKQYVLRVPPTARTARKAVAWTFGLQPNQYLPQIET